MTYYSLAVAEHGNLIPVIVEVDHDTLESALAAWPGYHEATDEENLIYETYWNLYHDGVWKPTAGADAQHRDQEIDLGDGGQHAIVGDEGDYWSWDLWGQWVHDEGIEPIDAGRAPDEGGAKTAALKAYASRQRIPEPSPRVVSQDEYRTAWSAAYWEARDLGYSTPEDCHHYADKATEELLDLLEGS